MDVKICQSCGRQIEPRKKWLKNWSEIKYCSERCRRTRPKTSLEDMIVTLLQKRGRGKTICPSEILDPEQKQDKAAMEEVRSAARRLVAKGIIQITQGGVVVDPSTAKGPIRLKLVTS